MILPVSKAHNSRLFFLRFTFTVSQDSSYTEAAVKRNSVIAKHLRMATFVCILILETRVNSGSCNESFAENSISMLTININFYSIK